jgi:hypothetical protein
MATITTQPKMACWYNWILVSSLAEACLTVKYEIAMVDSSNW